jgi:hypothetical protein
MSLPGHKARNRTNRKAEQRRMNLEETNRSRPLSLLLQNQQEGQQGCL